MKVRYIGKTDPIGFTRGEVYEVISVEKGWYRIIDPFLKDDYLFPPELFEIVKMQSIQKGNFHNGWVSMIFSDEELKILKKLNINPNVSEWTDDDYVHAEDVVGSEWTSEIQRSNMQETEYSRICMQLIDKITSL